MCAVKSAFALALAILLHPVFAIPVEAEAPPASRAVSDEPARAHDRLYQIVSRRAAKLASEPYRPPSTDLPSAFSKLDYDAFRKLRPLPETAVWRAEGAPFAILPLPRGWLYRDPVKIHLVEGGRTRTLSDTSRFMDFIDFPGVPESARDALGLSGLRILHKFGGEVAAPEAAVFQGASYFRAIARDLAYGLSARALAVRTFSPEGEEFPAFREFWVVKPAPEDPHIRLVALVDSPSLSAVYDFSIRPGDATVMDVQAEVYARRELSELGLAPMSSMYLHGAADRSRAEDFRNAVHDSDGLAIHTAAGERIWRPVINPSQLQVSAFQGDGIKGFGLIQRERSFDAFNDTEARYDRRPSLWVEPAGDWGPGEVILGEIPTVTEYEDNVAAFWRPSAPVRPGEPLRLGYRLTWNAEGPAGDGLAEVVATRSSALPEMRRFVIDFRNAGAWPSQLQPDVGASAGAISNVHLVEHPDPAVRRLVFDLAPQGAAVSELRATLRADASPLTETWLFRWTPD